MRLDFLDQISHMEIVASVIDDRNLDVGLEELRWGSCK
jgi:hypothetical protein